MAIFTSIFDIALLLGAPAVGFIIDGSGYLVAFGATGFFLVAGAVVYGIWDRRLVAAMSPAMVGEEVT
jgi:hypothetical protein